MTFRPPTSPVPGAADLQRMRLKFEAYAHLTNRLASESYLEFLARWVINSSPEPRLFGEAAEPWQWDRARRRKPLLESIARVNAAYTGPRRLWETMGRGHDKTSSTGRDMAWLLGYSRRRLRITVAAADKEQAGLLTQFMETEEALNPWFRGRLTFRRGEVEGTHTGSVLRIISSDAYSSYGLNDDVIIMDELTHWASPSLFETLMSGARKRQDAIILVITNAGTLGSWQHEALKVVQDSRAWNVFEAAGPLASWMSKEKTADERRLLPDPEVKRVLDNVWIDPSEESGFCSRAEAVACEELGTRLGLRDIDETDLQPVGPTGPHGQHWPVVTREYIGALDYGPRRDRTVGVVGYRDGDTFCVCHMRVWQGKDFPDKHVPVTVVEEWLEKIALGFPGVRVVIDPYQMEPVIQKYEHVLPIERFEPRGGRSNFELAQVLRELLANRRLAVYPGCGTIIAPNDLRVMEKHSFVDELCELIVVPKSYGYRLDHRPRKHDDRVVAVGMAAWRAMGFTRKRLLKLHDAYF